MQGYKSIKTDLIHIIFSFVSQLKEEGDGVYESEESDDDDTDSDISIDENDEPKSDNEDEGPKKKRRVVTKAYKVCWSEIMKFCFISLTL